MSLHAKGLQKHLLVSQDILIEWEEWSDWLKSLVLRNFDFMSDCSRLIWYWEGDRCNTVGYVVDGYDPRLIIIIHSKRDTEKSCTLFEYTWLVLPFEE